MPPKYVTVFDCKNEINEIRNEETISQQWVIWRKKKENYFPEYPGHFFSWFKYCNWTTCIRGKNELIMVVLKGYGDYSSYNMAARKWTLCDIRTVIFLGPHHPIFLLHCFAYMLSWKQGSLRKIDFNLNYRQDR